MSDEVEGGFRLVCGDHVSCVVDQGEPEIVVDFSPSFILALVGPDVLFSSLPIVDIFPV